MKTLDLQPVFKPDVTVIPNYIIDKELREANELQLKVYLYIMRNVGAGIPVQISVMADYFNETEKDISRAVSFWEKRGVLAYAAPASTSPSVSPDTAGSLSHLNGAALSRDEFDALKNRQDFKELSFVAEAYLGKPLNRSDLEILIFIKNTLNFSNELIEFLLEYCAERGKKSFKYIQTVACSWAEKGITTPEEAQTGALIHNQRVYAVMNALGKKSEPTNTELGYINRWYQQYAFEADVILEACKRTVLATDTHRFAYCDKILSSWYTKGIHHVKDIARADASFQTRKKQEQAVKAPSYVANNPFLQHTQSGVDYDALEKELLK